MSGGGTETPVGCEAAPGGGVKKKDSLGTAGSPAHLIIKDLGEIHSRLLDHRPVIQGETRYFVKEFERRCHGLCHVAQRKIHEQVFMKCLEEKVKNWPQLLHKNDSERNKNPSNEKRGLREMRVLKNLKNMIHETNEHTLPKCREAMQDNLNEVLQRLQAANHSVCRLQQKEQEQKKLYSDHLLASENQHITQWEDFMREQHSKQAEVDEEHRKAMERLKEQYAEMEKDLAKFSTF